MQQSFFDFFGRPDVEARDLYTNELASSIEDNEAIRKYLHLFCDAFGHHIEVNFDADAQIQVQVDDTKRFITKDSLTAYFLDKLYVPPNIYETPNSDYSSRDVISYSAFLRSISAPATTSADEQAQAIGTNRFSFIIGNIGTGKTLLVHKLLRDIQKEQKNKHSTNPLDKHIFNLPIYFDFEVHMKDGEGKLFPINDTFFNKLSNVLLASVANSPLFRARQSALSQVLAMGHGTTEAKFIDLVRTCHRVGLKPILILDNVDGYHYVYSQYTFFVKYREQQVRSIHENINRLTTSLRNGGSLGHLGMSVVIVARHYVYTQCLHTLQPVVSYQTPGSVYQLESVGEGRVVAARMQLFTTALEHIESDPRLRTHGEHYKRALERIKVLLGLEEKARLFREEAEDSKGPTRVLELIRNLCHHGNRGMVSFLSGLRLDFRDSSSLIERFLWDKPHTLALLYIAKLRSRYTQAQNHFPNLFLVDGIIQENPDFIDAHKPHLHTYWLKYLLLAYINSRPGRTTTYGKLRRIFVTAGGFDETIFSLALGSLATSTEFGCVELEPVGTELTQGRVSATTRGTTLVSNTQHSGARFCFSFTYLQLIVDDFLMSYPKLALKKIYTPQMNLGYLFKEEDIYARENAHYLEKKMRCVLTLLRVLELSYKHEEQLRSELFAVLRDEAPSVLLIFDDVVKSLFHEFRRISHTLKHEKSEKLMRELRQYWQELDESTDLERQISDYFASGVPIEV